MNWWKNKRAGITGSLSKTFKRAEYILLQKVYFFLKNNLTDTPVKSKFSLSLFSR